MDDCLVGVGGGGCMEVEKGKGGINSNEKIQ